MGAKNSKSTSDKNTLDIAIIGMTGAGKSSLVNALQGMTNDEEGSAEVGMVNITAQPKAYQHPTFPNVNIWDLPGTTTPLFKPAEYLSKYDFFIIVSSDRFTEGDARLVCEIQKMKKEFYYVYSKIDCILHVERRKPNFCEDRILKQIRDYCCEALTEKTGLSSPKVFLVSSWDLDKYDFPLLQSMLVNEIYAPWRHASMPAVPQDQERKSSDCLSEPSEGAAIRSPILNTGFGLELEQIKAFLGGKTLQDAKAEIQQYLQALENSTLDIGITGEAGAGKSSLVNALRGMTDYQEGSAKTGRTQTTMIPEGYPHPTFPKVTIWDLPGIGTPQFKPEEYLKKVNFSKYDFFIIVAGDRYTENDTKLACEIQKMHKKFYYVRSKMDQAMEAARRDPQFKEDQTLEEIRNYCCDNLIKAQVSSPVVFLISSRDLKLYDFPNLLETLENGLDDLKRHALTLAIPTFSGDILNKKKALLQDLIWKLAFVSCAVGTVPVSDLSLVCDTCILVNALILFCEAFGLDEDSLCRLAKLVGKPVNMLRSVIKKSPLVSEITPNLICDCLSKSSLFTSLSKIRMVCNFVPLLGSLVGGASSFVITYCMLNNFLEDAKEDAENVFAKAAE